MSSFIDLHESQLKALGVPERLYGPMERQMKSRLTRGSTFRPSICTDISNLKYDLFEDSLSVIPHLVTWEADDGGKLLVCMESYSDDELRDVLVACSQQSAASIDKNATREVLQNEIIANIWTKSSPYRYIDNVTYMALPAIPDLNQSDNPNLATFPFVYFADGGTTTTACTVVFPIDSIAGTEDLSIDYCPVWKCGGNEIVRMARLVGLLGSNAPVEAIQTVKEAAANHMKDLHLARQQKLERLKMPQGNSAGELTRSLLKVFTDHDDPMHLHHPVSGLTDERFVMTDDLGEADVIYSFHHILSPSFQKQIREKIDADRVKNIFINQFPFEGAFVQKDHLATGVQKQHGAPQPFWGIKSFDLDIQLAAFVGSAVLSREKQIMEYDEESVMAPVWIIKPAHGTQSKGHVVTHNLAQVIRLLECGGSRVAQKYIENPVCYEGRKVDCRVYILLRDATPDHIELYAHNRCFFRIADKQHNISSSADLFDKKRVLSAMHLFRSESEKCEASKLPVDHDTISKLESDYGSIGFKWKDDILPKIHVLAKELFGGMTVAYPAMADGEMISRALYGLDIMFEIVDDEIFPKLTEVTFCPQNNAICDAYERDEDLYRSFNNDIFKCLFFGETSDDLTRIT